MSEIAVIVSAPEGSQATATKIRTDTKEVIGNSMTFSGAIQFSIEEGESIQIDNVSQPAASE